MTSAPATDPVALRIIAGEFGGRQITAPPGRKTRPTAEAVREAWFSALGEHVRGARVLDLFAGSGALGIEALSRGASSVIFVESDSGAASVLRRNLRELEIGQRARVARQDVGRFLQHAGKNMEMHKLALADPPYGSEWPRRLAEDLVARPYAKLLCVEHAPGALPAPIPPGEEGDPGEAARSEGEGKDPEERVRPSARPEASEPARPIATVVWQREYGDTVLSFLSPVSDAAESEGRRRAAGDHPEARS